jgi:hypothetical protein
VKFLLKRGVDEHRRVMVILSDIALSDAAKDRIIRFVTKALNMLILLILRKE